MKHKISVAFCVILIILTVGFIWNNSRKPAKQSQADSAAITEKIENVISKDASGDENSFIKLSVAKIRKAAHAIEFFVLGAVLTALTFILKKRFTPQLLWNILSAALAIAVVDESIQILSGRGPTVYDVLLDFCGAVIGFLLTLFISFIISSLKRGKRKYAKN